MLETQSCFELGSQLLLDLSEADAICVLLVVLLGARLLFTCEIMNSFVLHAPAGT